MSCRSGTLGGVGICDVGGGVVEDDARIARVGRLRRALLSMLAMIWP